MSFLSFDEKTQGIIVSPEAKNFEAIKSLSEKDKSTDKRFYNNSLKFIYHVFKKSHIFFNLSINERKSKTSELYLGGQDYNKYEDDSAIKAVIKVYLSLEYSQNEWTYQTIKNDINDMRNSINLIPLTKTITISQDVDIEVPCGEEGKNITRTVKVKKTITVDNTKERMDALDRLLKLTETEEKFRDVITRENKMKEHNQDLSLLEQGYLKK